METIDVTRKTREVMAEYAREVITRRALPDYRDGLKPVQRLILWVMHQQRLTYAARYMKVAKVSGLVLGYHAHGSGSVDEAIATMSQEWIQRCPLVDIHGNNGSVDGSPHAASRYIECRQAPEADLLTRDLGRDGVDMIDNYDATAKQPNVLPSAIPQALVNGTSGIALGMATSILPHNPIELLELVKLQAAGQLTLAKAEKIFKGPDFPVGNEIILTPDTSVTQELTSAQATFTVRARSHVEGQSIIITEVPAFMPNSSKLTAAICKLIANVAYVKTAAIVDDNFPNIRIVIECKRDTSSEQVQQLHELIMRKALTGKVNCNNLMIVNGRPRQVSVLEYVKLFTQFRLDTLKRMWAHDMEVASQQLEYVTAELMLANDPSKLVMITGQAHSKTEFVTLLREHYGMTQRQAEHAAQLPVHTLCRNDDKRMSALRERESTLTDETRKLQHLLTIGATDGLLQDCDETIRFLRAQKLDKRLTHTGQPIEPSHTSGHEPAAMLTSTLPHKPRRVSTVTNTTVSCLTDSDGADMATSIRCYTDDYVGCVLASGKMIIRLVNDMPDTEHYSRTMQDVNVNDRIVSIIILQPGCKLITLSNMGYMKCIPYDVIMPSTTTKRYASRLHPVSNLKHGVDTLRTVFCCEHPDREELIVTCKRKRKPEQVIDLAIVSQRSDTGYSAGAKYCNTHNGVDTIISVQRQVKGVSCQKAC